MEVRAGNSGDQQSPRNHHLLVKYILAPLAWWALVGSGGAALVVGDGARGGRGGRGGGVEGAQRGRGACSQNASHQFCPRPSVERTANLLQTHERRTTLTNRLRSLLQKKSGTTSYVFALLGSAP